jgi:CheY-like chemotaxis protein
MRSTLLLIEDEETDALLFQRALDSAGIELQCEVVTNGPDAIGYLAGDGRFTDRGRFPLPALVLLDLNLPGWSGCEVLRRIRKDHGRALAVIILTASRERRDIMSAYELGANAYVVKPGTMTDLKLLVKDLCTFWLRHNQLPPSEERSADNGDQ